MAEVFLAKAAGPMGFEKTLVLKRILPELAEETSFVQMFLSEARLAARLTHPNIVQIFDFGESEGTYFLAMEYIDGPSLRTLIKRAAAQGLSLPPTVCARLIAHACEGLAFAHDFTDPETGAPMGLIHRDVSSDNILLSRQGAVKVVDFGIAKAAGQSHKTESGVIKGKLAYMPPEQLRAKELDRRADVYALGVVLYELLTGQRPYAAASDAGLMQAILYEQPIPAAKHRPDLPQPLRRILSKALAKEREQRYPDCHALQADLEAFIVSVGRPVMTQQVAQLIHQTSTNPELPALSQPLPPALTPPPPASLAEPPFLVRKRPAPSSNEAVTANQRAPQAPKEEEPRALVTPPPRRLEREPMTVQARIPAASRRPTPPPVDVDHQEQRPTRADSPVWRPVMSAEKPRSSNRWVPTLLGGLMVVAGGGVVSSKTCAQPEVQGTALAAELPRAQPTVALAKPPETGLPPSPEADEPDTGLAVAPEPVPAEQPAQERSPVKPKQPAPGTSRGAFKGTLELRVRPYATVYVDGKRMGDTPLRPLELPAGPHTVKLVNPSIPKEKLLVVDVKAGQNSLEKINLLED
ncbi:serine/threonine-protein kinase [Archangium violaceum]|uniref:serine/threonine-protein kinase n=1 Tax=Archangium violaceum TaxID=83451 RepID=UPI001EF6866F|nr:serine/threonine-protein kinase [Archangium violaceum]